MPSQAEESEIGVIFGVFFLLLLQRWQLFIPQAKGNEESMLSSEYIEYREELLDDY